MPPDVCVDARLWRLKALEAFAIAEHTTNPECRAMLLRIGAGYEQLAELTEKNADQRPFSLVGSPTQH